MFTKQGIALYLDITNVGFDTNEVDDSELLL